MKILVAGMGRSGSTALFNIIRIILNKKNINYKSNYTHRHESGNSLIKYHGYDEVLKNTSDYIFTTKRELKDCLGSHFRFTHEPKGKRTLKELCDQYLHYHIIWEKHSTYEFVYEKYKKDPVKIVKEVASVLHFNDVNEKEVLEELEKQTKDITKGNKENGFQSPTLIFKIPKYV